MSITEDGSSPAVLHISAAQTGTTASFTPPAGTTILVRAALDGNAAAITTAAISDSAGHTYTKLIEQHPNDATVGGSSVVAICDNPSSAAMTVTVAWSGGGGANDGDISVKVLNGALAVASQNGATVGATIHGAALAAALTPTQIGSRIYGAVSDYTTNAVLSAQSTTTIDDQFNDAGSGDTWAVFKANADTSSLSSTTYGSTTSASGLLAAAEIKATATGSFDAQVSVTRQQSSVTRVGPVVVAPTIGPPQVIQLPQITVVRHVKQPPAPFPIAVNPPLLPAQAQPVAPIMVAPQARLAQPPIISVSQPQMAAAIAGILPSTAAVVAQQFRPATVAPIVITPPPLPQPPAPITVIPSQSQPPLSATITLTPSPLPQATAPIVVVTSIWQPRQPQIVVSQPQLPVVAGILPPAPILVAAAFVRPVFLPTSVSPPPFLGPSALPPAPILVVPTFTRPGTLPCQGSPPQLPGSAPDISRPGSLSTSTTSGFFGPATAGATLADSTTASQVGNSSAGPQIAPTTSGGDA